MSAEVDALLLIGIYLIFAAPILALIPFSAFSVVFLIGLGIVFLGFFLTGNPIRRGQK
jgi:hypothetical protein